MNNINLIKKTSKKITVRSILIYLDGKLIDLINAINNNRYNRILKKMEKLK